MLNVIFLLIVFAFLFILITLLLTSMRSSADQELFKQMSNRTRTRPQEIYIKMNTHISQLQNQVASFNIAEEKIQHRMEKYARHGASHKQSRLKSMTQPKYQELLLNCQLPLPDKNSSKVSRIRRGVSTKSGKEFKTYGVNSGLGSIVGIKGQAQSKVFNSKLEQSKLATADIKSRTHQMKSTMVNTTYQNKSSAVASHFPNQANLSVTQSVVFAKNKPIVIKSPKKSVKTLRQKVQEKQMKLESEWQKTQNLRGKISSCIGDEDLHRAQKSTFAMTRITNVIDKVKKSRLSTTSGVGRQFFTLQSSQTL